MKDSKEALETLGNVKVAVTTIRSGITHFKTLKEQYESEFEVLERELFIRKELKDFDGYQRQLEKLEKENKVLREKVNHFKNVKNRYRRNQKLVEKENTKLKEALKFLCEELEIKLCHTDWMSFDEEYYLDYRSDIDLRALHRITKEKYNLLEGVLENE